MAKEEGAKTVVYGGKNDVQKIYAGTLGGQSMTKMTLDIEIKVRYLGSSERKLSLMTRHG